MVKGLSLEEKRKRMMDHFLEKQAVFTLKELEKDMPKLKGIVSQSVKDVLQGLCDDGMIDSDKIGSGNFFWAFPSKASSLRHNKIARLKSSIEEANLSISTLGEKKRKLETQREDSDDRSNKMAKLSQLQQESSQLDVELQKYADSDPERLGKLGAASSVCKNATNRWTDNIWELLSFFKTKKPELTDNEFFKYFGLPLDLDYV
eukprot:CAMPEP_0175090240 /NCGR_PEP_ID=MMETSP0086_2-20121207/1224_1 /TAXON_ID=136419 /ORGANISM="Unknown Unknown, Strain D1" /LENGTH=203 /DNA_ID=CAMNT_0016362823 /DNA_START=10 /DNA_END=621 /DNA_ORIENTATION=-